MRIQRTAGVLVSGSITFVLALTACGGQRGGPCPTTPAASSSTASASSAAPVSPLHTVQAGTPTEFRTRMFMEDTYPAHAVTFANGVTSIPDVTYATVPGFRPMKLDLYLPPGPKGGAHPFVIYLHAGGWMFGSPRMHGAVTNWPEVLASLAAKGYVVASVSYRLLGEAPFPAAVQDAKAAVRFLRAHAGEYGVDKTRGVAWGASGGAQIAALVAVACGVPSLEPASHGPSESTCVQGGIGFSGVYDFATYQAPSVKQYLRCVKEPCSLEENAKLASPVTHVDAQDPPMLLVHGAADTQVSPEQSKSFYQALTSKGVRAELVLVPGAEHALLGTTAEATQHDNAEAVDKAFAFIDALFAAKK